MSKTSVKFKADPEVHSTIYLYVGYIYVSQEISDWNIGGCNVLKDLG